MTTNAIIITLGLLIFWGHYLSGVFERHGIPDVLGLMVTGVFIGPVLHIVDARDLGQFSSIFSNLVLLFILFESGLALRFDEITQSLKASALLTFLGFSITATLIALFLWSVAGVSIAASIFAGTALGGTSSAVVVGLVRKLPILPKTSATLIIESAETDVFTLAIPLSILGVMLATAQLAPMDVLSHFLASLFMALGMGLLGGFAWAYILARLPALKGTKFSTPAFLFVLYGLTEALNFSGALTALTFGIVLGNLRYLEPQFLQRLLPTQRIMLPRSEQDFFAQIVFLLRVFFFVFIGISMHINRLDILAWGAAVTALVFIARIALIRCIADRTLPLLDRATLSHMIPKGLGAAVMATLPLQSGHVEGAFVQAFCFAVILFSTLYCVGLYLLCQTTLGAQLYTLLLGQTRPGGEHAYEAPPVLPDENLQPLSGWQERPE